jgi:hypothetical protein
MRDVLFWTGDSGIIYATDLCRFGALFHHRPGVYIFCKPDRNRSDRWLPIYVGETDNFSDQLDINLQNHHRWASIRREGATNVCTIIKVGGRDARTWFAADLITGLDPVCNRQ